MLNEIITGNSGFCVSTASTVCTRLWAPEVAPSGLITRSCRRLQAGRGHRAGSGTSRRDYRRRAGSRCWPQSSARVVHAEPAPGRHWGRSSGDWPRRISARKRPCPPGAPDPRPLAITHWCAAFGERAGYLPHGSAEICASVNRCGKSSRRVPARLLVLTERLEGSVRRLAAADVSQEPTDHRKPPPPPVDRRLRWDRERPWPK